MGQDKSNCSWDWVWAYWELWASPVLDPFRVLPGGDLKIDMARDPERYLKISYVNTVSPPA